MDTQICTRRIHSCFYAYFIHFRSTCVYLLPYVTNSWSYAWLSIRIVFQYFFSLFACLLACSLVDNIIHRFSHGHNYVSYVCVCVLMGFSLLFPLCRCLPSQFLFCFGSHFNLSSAIIAMYLYYILLLKLKLLLLLFYIFVFSLFLSHVVQMLLFWCVVASTFGYF